MAPIRILQIVPAMNLGGMETFIMNVYRHVDRDRVQFDFLTHYAAPGYYDEEIEALGGRIYRLSVREDNNLFRYLKQLDRFFADHPEYTVVHGHYSGFGMFYNHYAKKHGVAVRIGHSHSTGSERGLTGFLDKCMSRCFSRGLTRRLSCGVDAGKALYRKKPFDVYPVGIDLGRFAFDPGLRKQMRGAWGLDADAVVYGHIGRFDPVKNHDFLLEVFTAIYARQPSARLLLVGDGPLRGEVEAKAALLGLEGKVVFAGNRSDTPACYSAMDCFMMPSHYEGLPLVLVEAQANGLPCFVSSAVSAEAGITPSVHFLPLSSGPGFWADSILGVPLARQDNRAALAAAGYDIEATAKRLQALYLQLA